MVSRKIIKLKDIADIEMGQSPKGNTYNSDNNGMPFLQGNKTFGRLYPIIDTWTTDPKKIGKRNSILMSVRAPVGEINIANQDICIGRGLCSISMKNGNTKYLYYVLKNSISQIKSKTTGTVFDSINKKELENIEIVDFDETTQNKIIKILSQVDDKIELNNKINDNLLKIIDNVYKEEFAELEVFDKAENIANITIGKTPPRSISECFSQNDCDIKWVSISDLGKCGTYVNDTSERLTRDAVEKYNVKIIPKETVILSFKLTVGRVAITRDEMTTNEAIAHFNLNSKDMKYFIYCYLRNFDFGSLGSTSSIATAVNSKIIKAMPIAIPDAEKLIKFNNIVNSLFEKVKNNEIENETLSDLRDTLLPKLMNGEIDLDKIEI